MNINHAHIYPYIPHTHTVHTLIKGIRNCTVPQESLKICDHLLLTFSCTDNPNILIVEAVDLGLCRWCMTVSDSALTARAVCVHLPNGTNRERKEITLRSSYGIAIPQLPADHVCINYVPSVIAYGPPFPSQKYLYSALILVVTVLKAQGTRIDTWIRRGWRKRYKSCSVWLPLDDLSCTHY